MDLSTVESWIFRFRRAISRSEGSALIGYIATGDGAVSSNVQAELDKANTHIADNSLHSRAIEQYKIVADGSALGTGDGKYFIVIPEEYNGWELINAHAMVSTVSSSGLPTYQLYNVTDSVDIMTTKISIDANENTSYTAATPPVINSTNAVMATGDIIRIDKDVAGTGEKGDTIILVFQAP